MHEIDPLSDDLIGLAEAARRLPGQPAPSTLYRWAMSGCRGIYLGYVRVGRRLYTTPEALRAFMAALAELDRRGQRRADAGEVKRPRRDADAAERRRA